VKLHEKLGFFHTGTSRQVGFKKGEWIDVGLWQKELALRVPDPAEPRPFASVGALE
jgi:phosphinothricin acetyltransferase